MATHAVAYAEQWRLHEVGIFVVACERSPRRSGAPTHERRARAGVVGLTRCRCARESDRGEALRRAGVGELLLHRGDVDFRRGIGARGQRSAPPGRRAEWGSGPVVKMCSSDVIDGSLSSRHHRSAPRRPRAGVAGSRSWRPFTSVPLRELRSSITSAGPWQREARVRRRRRTAH